LAFAARALASRSGAAGVGASVPELGWLTVDSESLLAIPITRPGSIKTHEMPATRALQMQ